MPVTLNPSDKSAQIALSGGNLTATKDAAVFWAGARATASLPAGSKRFWEVTLNINPQVGTNDSGVGIATAGATLANYAGIDSNSVGHYDGAGSVVINNTVVATCETYTAGDVIGVAVDLANSRLWVRKNGGAWNNSGSANPTTNTGGVSLSGLAAGPYYPFVTLYQNAAVTVNFGQSVLAYSPPSGFVAVDPMTALEATGMAVAAPVLGTPTLSQAHQFTGSPPALAAPSLGRPPFGVHLAALELTTASPEAGPGRMSPWFGMTTTAEAWTQLAP